MTDDRESSAHRDIPARLVLEDGAVFEGTLFGHTGATSGEVVFNTGMVGYPETLSDPSYTGQILTLTYPLIGNYGVTDLVLDEHGIPRGFESTKLTVAGLVVSEYARWYSHHTATRSLGDWMAEQGVVGIQGIDTRALTRHLRSKGSMLGKIVTAQDEVGFVDTMATHLVEQVSPRDVTELSCGVPGASKVVVVDCGCKANILRSLLSRGVDVVRVPHDHYFLDIRYDGLVLSNGPGDPQMCAKTVRHVEHSLALGKPILGICLGNQILSLAAGAETYKLKFGHRGQNQPCIEVGWNAEGEAVDTHRCVITSQNHGYAVRPDKLPSEWRVWFKNANDGTVEGVKHRSRPFMGVQFHPEAHPGPMDTGWIFDEFVEAVKGGAA